MTLNVPVKLKRNGAILAVVAAWNINTRTGTRQYLPTFTHPTERPSTKFFSTSRIESLDHKLIATTRHTTKCAGKERFLASLASLVAIACSMAVAGIAVSIAFSKSLLCIIGDSKEKSLRCTTVHFQCWLQSLIYTTLSLNWTVLAYLLPSALIWQSQLAEPEFRLWTQFPSPVWTGSKFCHRVFG